MRYASDGLVRGARSMIQKSVWKTVRAAAVLPQAPFVSKMRRAVKVAERGASVTPARR